MNIFKEWIDKLKKAPLEKDHAGPVYTPIPDITPLPIQVDELFVDGWYDGAVKCPANEGRIGPKITPRTIVVHTTDTMPGGFRAIIKSWMTTRGAGNAAHFMVGRTEADGIVQFVPINRNGNHAGGITHGWWQVMGSGKVHPNTISIGIEIDAGGKLRKLPTGVVIHPDTKRVVKDPDIYWDTEGKPWHRVTDYQLAILQELIRDLRSTLSFFNFGNYIIPSGDYKDNGALLAKSTKNWLVGHWTLDPYNKSDPGPQVMEIINEFK